MRDEADNDRGSRNFKSSHFEEPNILAHVRFNDRTIDGKKTLFVEEVQSDLHQAGKRTGYQRPAAQAKVAELKGELDALRPAVNEMIERNGRLGFDTVREARSAISHEDPRQWDLSGEDLAWRNGSTMRRIACALPAKCSTAAVPDAPFKTTWPELSMKRMIRYAAEHGYDQIAWTSGETQAARYDLSKQIERVNVAKESDGTFTLDAITNDGRPVALGETIKPEGLADIVGKELADKITAQDEAFKAYSGLDLKVGGEGMKGFYDQILPATVNKLVKKFDTKVGKAELDTSERPGTTGPRRAARRPDRRARRPASHAKRGRRQNPFTPSRFPTNSTKSRPSKALHFSRAPRAPKPASFAANGAGPRKISAM